MGEVRPITAGGGKIGEIVVGITGASGVIYGIRLLQVLRERGCITHLIISSAAKRIIGLETEWAVDEVLGLASRAYEQSDLAASIASGSYPIHAMVVAPCSMKTLAAIACGISDGLVARSADVCLKERRRLVLVTREMPLSLVHLRNMVAVTEAGGVIMPASPSFYTLPRGLDDLIDLVVGRALDLLGIEHRLHPRWGVDVECTQSEKPCDI